MTARRGSLTSQQINQTGRVMNHKQGYGQQQCHTTELSPDGLREHDDMAGSD